MLRYRRNALGGTQKETTGCRSTTRETNAPLQAGAVGVRAPVATPGRADPQLENPLAVRLFKV
jgi:hypothetical protein